MLLDRLKLAGELVKFRISLTVALSSASVCVLASGGFAPRLAGVTAGVFLAACGACALNEHQERREDGLMERTRGRPIPSGRIAPRHALAAAAALIAAGTFLLLASAGSAAALLGLFGVFWYNGVYTPLKRTSAFAVVPGSIVGAVAPAIGWAAAGLPLLDPRLLALAFFFFMWQVPHFWLLASRYGPQYKEAGFPALTEVFRRDQIARLVFMWTITAAASALLLPLFGATGSPAVCLLLILAAARLSWKAAALLRAGMGEPWRATFASVNTFALVVMVLLSLDPRLR